MMNSSDSSLSSRIGEVLLRGAESVLGVSRFDSLRHILAHGIIAKPLLETSIFLFNISVRSFY
jgi:hypothetical protein